MCLFTSSPVLFIIQNPNLKGSGKKSQEFPSMKKGATESGANPPMKTVGAKMVEDAADTASVRAFQKHLCFSL